MRRLLTSAPRLMRIVPTLLVSGIVLASCVTASAPHVTGIPSIGISVPLHLSACTTSDSCIAIGTTSSSTPPTSVGEYRESNGTWSSLVVPNAPSSILTSSSCVSTTCVIGGVEPAGNLIWKYNASSQSVSASATPKGGIGIRALDCFAPTSCVAVIASAASSISRISFTQNLATSWSREAPLLWSTNDTIDNIICTDLSNCLVSAINDQHKLVLEVTHDAGASWSRRRTPSLWSSLSSLTCVNLRCVGIVTTSTSELIARTSTFGRQWRWIGAAARPEALSCTSIDTCVVVGETNANQPWLAVLNTLSLRMAHLRYVPSPLIDVACGSRICASIGVSTVLVYRP
jgi:hypothetical protein